VLLDLPKSTNSQAHGPDLLAPSQQQASESVRVADSGHLARHRKRND
jgi:hypothetical protein